MCRKRAVEEIQALKSGDTVDPSEGLSILQYSGYFYSADVFCQRCKGSHSLTNVSYLI